MQINEDSVREIVAGVVQGLNLNQATDQTPNPAEASQEEVCGNGILSDVDSAVAAAEMAYQELATLSLETRKVIVERMRKAILDHVELISKTAHEETGFGRYETKVIKNELAALKTPGVEDIEPSAYTDDCGLTLIERAPYGVIGAIIPCTNPTATVICNGIGMVAAGNSVVFNPHPVSKRSSCLTISILNDAVVAAGGPRNLLVGISRPTIQSAQAMMKHPGVKLLAVTGGPGVVKVAMASGKKAIAAGPGNPPCVVDETAELDKAGKAIVDGASFDNNIICICEKEVIAVASIADQLKQEMVKNGAFELDVAQTEKITALVIDEPGCPGNDGMANKAFVGKNAAFIAQAIGLDVPESTKILLCEVTREHPLVWTEQLMPVIPLVRVAHVDDAIDLAVECEHGFRHTATMHSLNIAKLSKMARVMNCSIFVKNGPSYCGLGKGGAGFASFTIASPTGEGVTRARTFTRERRCVVVDHFRIT
ncbi:MAG: aldehyde dehydrogenase EutE [Planctomycetes bacterium]|nr:aldehyde dehydrogenase EutE [Planctomycetota bacterium]